MAVPFLYSLAGKYDAEDVRIIIRKRYGKNTENIRIHILKGVLGGLSP